MQTMKEISKAFNKEILKKNGWPDDLEEALKMFDSTVEIFREACRETDFVLNEETILKTRKYLISCYD